ncbi:MAG: Holliday junction branch migration protein RuvA [Deltaproteobacteria bacterium]|nr:Holliday junction branch migration protein RuvA [Deltaproteobacteria bacterium]
MIAQLKGVLESKVPSEIIVDVGGVGYQVSIPLSTYDQLPEIGEPVRLKTHTHVREDAIQIFGFLTASEKEFFKLLISVSKIGPKMALAILSGLDAGSLRSAILDEDVGRLSGIPGVGRKTAERICMELKDKVPPGLDTEGGGTANREVLEECPYKDAVAALIHLGYKRGEVAEIIRGLASEEEGRSVEELIRESLRSLSKA